jgi:hypothetical protein
MDVPAQRAESGQPAWSVVRRCRRTCRRGRRRGPGRSGPRGRRGRRGPPHRRSRAASTRPRGRASGLEDEVEVGRARLEGHRYLAVPGPRPRIRGDQPCDHVSGQHRRCESHGDGEGAGRARPEVPAGVGDLGDGGCRATGQADRQLGGCRDRRPPRGRRHPPPGSPAAPAPQWRPRPRVWSPRAPHDVDPPPATHVARSTYDARQRDADRQTSTRRSHW